MNLLYDRKFDLHKNTNIVYDLKLGYKSSHTLALDEIAQGSRGAGYRLGPGNFTRELRKRRVVC